MAQDVAGSLVELLEKINFSSIKDVQLLDDGFNPHTDADLDVNEILIQGLGEILPIPVISEENFESYPEGAAYWLIDPLDGTLNVIRGDGPVAVSIALIEADGSCTTGAVKLLHTGIIAVTTGTELHTYHSSEVARPERSGGGPFIGFSMPAEPFNDLEAMMRPVTACWQRGWVTRQSGSATADATAVALGTLDAFFQQGTQKWDIAGADALARAAGKYTWVRERTEAIQGIGTIDYASASTPELLAAIVESIETGDKVLNKGLI